MRTILLSTTLALVSGHGFIVNDRKDLANRHGGWQDPKVPRACCERTQPAVGVIFTVTISTTV